MKDGTLKRNNAGFLIGTDSPSYLEMTIFSALINYFDKRLQSVRFYVSKTSSLYIRSPLDAIKDFVTCKYPGYQAINLNPTTRCKIIFKINPPDRVLPTWRREGNIPPSH